jgi:drug/metabolite transporter (DMT)-like permease
VTRRSSILFAALGLAWGIPYLLIKVAGEELPPSTMVLARTALAALILLPIALLRREVAPVLRHWRPVLAYTVAEIILPWYFLAHAEQDLPSSTAGLLIAAVPIEFVNVTGNLQPTIAWALTGIGFASASVALLRMSNDEFDLPPVPSVSSEKD